MVVLVPAYEPDERLVALVRALRRAAPDVPVVVVDDGSGPAHAAVVAEAGRAGADVVAHRVNRGKGAALRTGVAHVLRAYPGQDVVCADCDGQHLVRDVLTVARRVADGDAAVVLGARRFAGDDVPARSRWGNAATRVAFRLGTGRALQDTQTGLRGYPATVLPWLLDVPGDRFEYELSVLLRAVEERRAVVEVPIATVYLDQNSSSHFRPVVDSVRVYAPLLRFVASSLVGFVVDVLGLLVLTALTGSLLAAAVGARLASAAVNFGLNRRWVFRHRTRAPLLREAVAYALLAGTLLLAGYGSLVALTHLGMPLLAAKVVTDLVLFLVGYRVQRTAVFRQATRTTTDRAAARPHDPATGTVRAREPGAVAAHDPSPSGSMTG